MTTPLKEFAELDHVRSLSSFGWYIACSVPEHYLHDNGIIYDTCGDLGTSTGWFQSKAHALRVAEAYYNKHGLVYPYSSSITSAVVESQVMDFE